MTETPTRHGEKLTTGLPKPDAKIRCQNQRVGDLSELGLRQYQDSHHPFQCLCNTILL